ncbi:MAG: ribosomal RNA small subunit methyltransferase A [Acidobacteria bacterium]|nr:ribosomal RNA small subunit methyltransferase A [Acidobacteriota bacterium]
MKRKIQATGSRRRRLGQHFLEPGWVARVIDTVAPEAHEHILEIGPGHGALTLPLAARAARIVAVERDPALARGLQERVPDTVEIVEQDILADDLREWARRLRNHGPADATLRLAGNLPYSISSPILTMMLRSARAAGFRDAVLMLQREVAERVVAEPGMRDYGPLAILTMLHATARCVLQLPPRAFRPPPKVRSTVVTLRFRDLPCGPPDPARFDAFVRRLFTRRRKQLVNALLPAEDPANRDPAGICRAAGIDPARRPGTLSLIELMALDAALVTAGG